MVATTGSAIAWVFLFVIIYYLFLKRDHKGERYTTLGCVLLVLNAFAGYFMVDEVSSFIAVIITAVYFIQTQAND